MREAREQISPATWHAYAHAMAARSTLGSWPSAETLLEVAQGEGADPWALLVLTRGELPGLTPDRPREPTGKIEGIFARDRYWTRPTVLVPTCEALWAVVLCDDMLYARLRDPWERQLDLRHLLRYARDWSRPTLGSELTPPRIQLELHP